MTTWFQLPIIMLAKIDITPGVEDACWIMRGSINSSGYPATRWNGKTRGGHRIAWLANYGPIPRGLFVCHRCDVKRCCNPNHLFLGTVKENVQDHIAKGGRMGAPKGANVGMSNGKAKLTVKDVEAIRRAYSLGETAYAIAKRYSRVHEPAIYKIIHGITWSKVSTPTSIRRNRNI